MRRFVTITLLSLLGCSEAECPIEYVAPDSIEHGSVLIDAYASYGFSVEQAHEVFKDLPGLTRIIVTSGEDDLIGELYVYESGYQWVGEPSYFRDKLIGGFILLRDSHYSCEWRDSVARVVVFDPRGATLENLRHEHLHAELYETSMDSDPYHLSSEWEGDKPTAREEWEVFGVWDNS